MQGLIPPHLNAHSTSQKRSIYNVRYHASKRGSELINIVGRLGFDVIFQLKQNKKKKLQTDFENDRLTSSSALFRERFIDKKASYKSILFA